LTTSVVGMSENTYPKPTSDEAVHLLAQSQRILTQKILDGDEADAALGMLQCLVDDHGYSAAWLSMAQIFTEGLHPDYGVDDGRAFEHLLQFLKAELDSRLSDDVAQQLAAVAKDAGPKLVSSLDCLKELVGRCKRDSVKSWLTLALMKAEEKRQAEDPEYQARKARVEEARKHREEAEQRRAAEEAARREGDIQLQRQRLQEAIEDANKLKVAANDLFTAGNLPGAPADMSRRNREEAAELYTQAIEALEEIVSEVETSVQQEGRKTLSVICGNLAQLYISAQQWVEAEQAARRSSDADPSNIKARYRIARALVGRGQHQEAAPVIDSALAGGNLGATQSDFWKLAETVDQALEGGFTWSAQKPKPGVDRDAREREMERRILGTWQYQPKSQFTLRVMPWGALLLCEDKMTVDMRRVSLLRWEGEFEKVPGFEVRIEYDPGTDILRTEFQPPAELAEEGVKEQGSHKFQARRVAEASGETPVPHFYQQGSTEEPVEDGAGREKTGKPRQAVVETQPEAPRDPEPDPVAAQPAAEAPSCLEIVGHASITGTFRRTGEAFNGQHVYFCSDTERYLYFRGGSWGVAARVDHHPLAAPFAARLPDARCSHPAESRRQRWLLGTGAEEHMSRDVVCRVAQPGSERPREDPDLIPKRANGVHEHENGHAGEGAAAGGPQQPSWLVSFVSSPTSLEFRFNATTGPKSIQDLVLAISEQCVRLEFAGENFAVPLPVGGAQPVAKFSKKKCTLCLQF